MSDGRAFTTYLSAGQAEGILQARLRAANNNQYRAVLQHDSAQVAAELRRMYGVPPPQLRDVN